MIGSTYIGVGTPLYVYKSDVVLALAAGSAGALVFTTGVSVMLMGAMVAVLPPMITIGRGCDPTGRRTNPAAAMI